MLLILCGPSGAGKSTLCRHLLANHPSFQLSVSCTTRAPRGQEVHGREYWFVSMAEFEEKLASDAFAEHAEVHGNRYGTLRTEIDGALSRQRSVVFDIDYQGAQQLRRAYPSAVSVMVLPPSMEELERRLRGRGTDTEEVIARRMAKARHEIAQTPEFHYTIVNDVPEAATAALDAIAHASVLATPLVWPRVRADFTGES